MVIERNEAWVWIDMDGEGKGKGAESRELSFGLSVSFKAIVTRRPRIKKSQCCLLPDRRGQIKSFAFLTAAS